MQHNPQKPNPNHNRREAKQHESKTGSQFKMGNIYPKQRHVQDVGRGTDDPDNVRRQKQDYFDNWELTLGEYRKSISTVY